MHLNFVFKWILHFSTFATITTAALQDSLLRFCMTRSLLKLKHAVLGSVLLIMYSSYNAFAAILTPDTALP